MESVLTLRLEKKLEIATNRTTELTEKIAKLKIENVSHNFDLFRIIANWKKKGKNSTVNTNLSIFWNCSQEQKDEKLWIVLARASIEEFEDKHSLRADINFSEIEPSSKIGFFERTRRIRELRFKWIFKNRRTHIGVQKLIERIEKNKFKPHTTDEFANFISVAYEELSYLLENKITEAGKGLFDFCLLTRNEKANAALRIFLSMYDFQKPSVRKIEWY